jgi:toxin FitB
MYLVDTNVVSELRRLRLANQNVVTWFSQQRTEDLYLSVISILEVEQGYLKLQRHDIKQAKVIRDWIDQNLIESFRGRILSIDTKIAQCCAALHVPDRKSYGDAMIAATAITHNMTIVTRNTADFQATGAKMINPWQVP